MAWLNFRHLYSFWMVARAGSFTQAAKQMRVAQSAVSSQVASLEAYLGEPLFVRSHRAIELTAAGEELLGYATAIFAKSQEIQAVFRDKDRPRLRRRLRLGVVGGASRNFVFRLLERYTDELDGAALSVSTGSYGELYTALKHSELDSIISIDLPSRKDLGQVVYQKLGESRMCVVATPELLERVRRPPGRRAKKGKGLEAPDAPGQVDVYMFRHPFEVDVLGKHVRPLVRPDLALRMDTDDIPLLRFFANSGRGLAVLPRVGVLEDLEAGTVAALELRRCPEVIIYGISMRDAATGLGPEDSAALWNRPD